MTQKLRANAPNPSGAYISVASSDRAKDRGFLCFFGAKHVRIQAPDGTVMQVPNHGKNADLATGTERSIRKWFIKWGLIVGGFVGAAAYIYKQVEPFLKAEGLL